MAIFCIAICFRIFHTAFWVTPHWATVTQVTPHGAMVTGVTPSWATLTGVTPHGATVTQVTPHWHSHALLGLKGHVTGLTRHTVAAKSLLCSQDGCVTWHCGHRLRDIPDHRHRNRRRRRIPDTGEQPGTMWRLVTRATSPRSRPRLSAVMTWTACR